MHLCPCGIYSLWKGRVSSTFTLTMITHCSKWREMGKNIAGQYYLVPRFRECFPDKVVIELWSKGYVRLHWAGDGAFPGEGSCMCKVFEGRMTTLLSRNGKRRETCNQQNKGYRGIKWGKRRRQLPNNAGPKKNSNHWRMIWPRLYVLKIIPAAV